MVFGGTTIKRATTRFQDFAGAPEDVFVVCPINGGLRAAGGGGTGMMEWILLAGALAGVMLGVLAAVPGLRWLQGAREKRALQALITQVHLKTVFAESGPARGGWGSEVDVARCRSAAADIRQQVRETVSELRPGSSAAADALLEMYRACDTYLLETERRGASFEARLRELRLVLNQGARRLSSGRHVQYLAPGQRAVVRRETLVAAARARTGPQRELAVAGPAAARAENRHGARGRDRERRGTVPVPARRPQDHSVPHAPVAAGVGKDRY